MMKMQKRPVPRPERMVGLPGLGDACDDMPREKRLRKWLDDHCLGLIDLCPVLGGCHKSYPGKVLISCTDRLPDHQREALIRFGIPEDLLPERTEIREPGRPRRPNPLAL